MKALKRFILMLQFFTRIPIRKQFNANSEDYGKGLIFAPIVGAIIGAALAGAAYGLLYLFSKAVVVVIVLVLYIVITGGLHLDGLGDTFDGIFSNRPKERILEIMRDSRVGTNAVLAIVCVELLNYATLSNISNTYFIEIIFLMPIAGRIGSLISAAVSTYARSGEGLGKSFIDYCGTKELVLGLVIYTVISVLTFNYKMWLIMLVPPISAFLLIKGFSKKIGGSTGDILGAVCELNQTIFLVMACAILV